MIPVHSDTYSSSMETSVDGESMVIAITINIGSCDGVEAA